ncbi:ABC transporter permease [Microbacterium sp. P01]|uniref:ABC transporter permease n=1 Tax=unclassified Microbacterium TaxID=2609290 RepID=UPI003671237E
MNPGRTLATAGRVLRQLSHDPRSLALMLLVPSLLIGLFAWLFVDQEGVFDRFGAAILALFPFIVMFLVTSITTLRERRSGTLERLLSTPLGKPDFIVGYACAFAVVAAVQALVTVAFAVGVCGLAVDGPLWQLGLVAVADAILGTALGLLASAFARTEFQAVQFMPVLIFPQIILGGLFVPRDQMPDVLRAVSDVLPLSYGIDAINAVTAGEGGAEVSGPLLIVFAFAIGALILASLTLRRRTA